MSRIRTIKPEFFTCEDIVGLSAYARLLYIALWCEADRDGRLVWRPITFKMRYLPVDVIDIEALCNELTSNDLVKLYGDGFAFIPSFTHHQHINPRETESKLPNPQKLSTREPRVNDATVTHREEGREGREGYDASKFNAFYAAYPKKKNRADAEKAFKALHVDDALLEKMISAIRISGESLDWKKENGAFIPYPGSWLRGRRWEDSIAGTTSDFLAGVT